MTHISHGVRTEYRQTSNLDGLPDSQASIIATRRAAREATQHPVVVGETTIVAYWQTPELGPPYLVIDIDTTGNKGDHGDAEPVNLKVTINDGIIYGEEN